MRIRKKEIRKLHKRREERYKALHKGQATPAVASASGASARAGAGGRTSTSGNSGNSGSGASGGARPGAAARPPRRPAAAPAEG